MLLFVYTTTSKRFVIFTCRYFKLSWNTTALSQLNCRNFSCSSILGHGTNLFSGIQKDNGMFVIVIIIIFNYSVEFWRQKWPQPSQWTDWRLFLRLQNYTTSSAQLLRWGFHYNVNSQLQTGQLETTLQSIKEASDMHWNELHLVNETHKQTFNHFYKVVTMDPC